MESFRLTVARPQAEHELPAPSPDAPIAWHEHRQRARVLRELFKDDPDWEVADWGATNDDKRTREIVHLLIDFVGQHHDAVAGAASVVAMEYGKKLMIDGLEAVAVNPLKRLVSRILRRTRKRDGILSMTLRPANSTRELIIFAEDDGTVRLISFDPETTDRYVIPVDRSGSLDLANIETRPASKPTAPT